MAEAIGKVNIKRPIDPERVNIEQDPFNPAAFVVTLELDSEPSYAWLTLFNQILWSSLDFWDRKVVIFGKGVKLATGSAGVSEKLQWLEGLVLATNRKVDEHNKTEKAMKKAETIRMLNDDAVRKDIQRWTSGRIIT